MKLIIGLGNPGDRYKNTRHNTGFIILDAIKDILFKNGYDFNDFSFDKDSNSEISKGAIDSEIFILVKPQTFMNNSGKAVKYFVDFYKLNPKNDIIVIYDDIDLKFLDIRTTGKSSGGHNGLQSIMDCLKTNNIKRIRIGILNKPKEDIMDTSSYVLSRFNPADLNKLKLISKEVYSAIFEEFIDK